MPKSSHSVGKFFSISIIETMLNNRFVSLQEGQEEDVAVIIHSLAQSCVYVLLMFCMWCESGVSVKLALQMFLSIWAHSPSFQCN